MFKEDSNKTKVINVTVESYNADGTVNIRYNGVLMPRQQAGEQTKIGLSPAILQNNNVLRLI